MNVIARTTLSNKSDLPPRARKTAEVRVGGRADRGGGDGSHGRNSKRGRSCLKSRIAGRGTVSIHGFVCLLLIALAPGRAPAQPNDSTPAGNSASGVVEQVARQSRASVVVISVEGREGGQAGTGTGFIVSEEGLIATNLHVIGEARPIGVQKADGTKLSVAGVHAWDRAQDLAILRVERPEQPLQALPLAEDMRVEDGQAIVVMGNPYGLRHSVVAGVVSGTREIEGRTMLQLAIPIEPGNSGGPVLDASGRVLGVVTMKSAVTNNLGFAVTAEALRTLLEKPNPVPMDRWLTIGVVDRKKWNPLFGANWRQRAGRLHVEGAGDGFGGRSLCLWRQEVPEVPYEVAVAVRLDDESGAAGLVFCADGSDRHYGFYPSGGRLRLSAFRGPTVFSWQVLQETACDAYRPGEWNWLKVRVQPDRLSCYVNDVLAIESTDRSFSKGFAGLAKFRETVADFREFRVAKQIPSNRPDPATLERLFGWIDELPEAGELQHQDLRPLLDEVAQGRAALRERARQLQQRADQLRDIADELHVVSVLDELEKLLDGSGDDFDLLRASLLIARLDDDEVDVDGYVAEVDRMASELTDRLPDSADDAARREALHRYMFEENGFHGSRFDYYHRANSYMNRVIEDREGLPITLSVLFMEFAARIGLHVEGVGLPGHFVVRCGQGEGSELIDVFEGGRVLGRDALEKKVLATSGQPLRDEHPKAAGNREIAARMLRNLLGLAERSSDRKAMLRYLEALVVVEPDSIEHRGMRAILRFQNGRREAAVSDLDWILDLTPPGLDMDRIQQMRDQFLHAPR